MKRIVECCTNCKYLSLSDKKEPCSSCYNPKTKVRKNFSVRKNPIF